MIPDKVYIVPMKTSENQDAFVGLAYESDKLLIDRTEYIRKEALLEWLNQMLEISAQSLEFQRNYTYRKVIDKLNEM